MLGGLRLNVVTASFPHKNLRGLEKWADILFTLRIFSPDDRMFMASF